MTVVEKINARNSNLYGPLCDKCNLYSHGCRCTINNNWKNRDLVFNMQRVYVKINNSNVNDEKSMTAPIQVLARDLVETLKDIELCGKTVDEVMKYALNNYDRL